MQQSTSKTRYLNLYKLIFAYESEKLGETIHVQNIKMGLGGSNKKRCNPQPFGTIILDYIYLEY